MPAGEAGAGRDRMGDRSQEDALGPMVEGLATALQCYQDRMGEHMVSLVNEQAALLAKLDAARQVLQRYSSSKVRVCFVFLHSGS